MLAALWRYRHFVFSAIRAELKGRFARSRLGALWYILNPLAQAAIYAVVLAQVLGARLPNMTGSAAYPVYLMAGMAAWGLFAEILNRCMTVFIDYAGPLKKISFPRLCLPLIVWGGALVNHAMLLAACAFVFLCLGYYPSATWTVLPFAILLISLFAFGLGVLLGILNVFSRDVAQAMGVVLQLWFWLTPIVYSYEAVPPHLRWVIDINPMAPLVRIYQDALLFHRWPDYHLLWLPGLIALGMFALSFAVFRRASAELVDAL
jgi:lipopolysaccharide transport system permease protein